MSRPTQPQPRVQMPEDLTAEQQIDWLAHWICDHTGHEAPSCVPQKGLREGEGAIESVIRMVLERNDELDRLKGVVAGLEEEAATTYREAIDGHKVAPCPVAYCPVCGAPEVDMDGFGCLACPRDPALCYCSHPAIEDGFCTICKDPEQRSSPHDMHASDINDPWQRVCAAKRLEVGEQLRMPDKRTWVTIESIRPEADTGVLFVAHAEVGFSRLGPAELVVVRRRQVR